jgi:rod shape-determining protein MreD
MMVNRTSGKRLQSSDRIPLIRLVLLTFLVGLLHVGFLSQITFRDVRPETLMLLGIVAPIRLGARSGAVIGFLAGLLTDTIGHGALGTWALILGLIGFLIGYSHDQAFSLTRERVPVLLVIGATIVAVGSFIAVSSVTTEDRSPSPRRLAETVALLCVYHSVLAFPMRTLVRIAVPLRSRR